jgi:ELWxxDGT repeat protein
MSFLSRGRLSKSRNASRRTGRVTRRPLYGFPLRLEVLEDRFLPSGTPHLLADIYPEQSSNAADYTNVDGTVFFRADDGTHGLELWRTDGTAAGTQMVKDINPGSGSSYPRYLTNLNGTLLFSANDGTHGDELWRSDGTAAGTVMVKDINPGSSGSYPTSDTFFDHGFTNVGGTVFFDANDGTHGEEPWRSDGTAGGTQMVKDINPGSASSTGSLHAPQYTNVNGTLFFEANDGTDGFQLWRSDGTASGTQMVTTDISDASYPSYLTNVGGTLFFEANDELWRSDGTAAGTRIVNNVDPNNPDFSPFFLANVGGTLFFSAYDPTHGNELWRSDGTAGGTQLVDDINPGSSGSYPMHLTNVGGTVFFRADDGTHGNELWRTDGTAAGTQMVKDINPGSASSYPDSLTNGGGTLFFSANDGTHGFELWSSNGTAGGTQLYDINPGSSGSNPGDLTNVGGTLFFSANDGTHGVEPWILAPSPSLSSQTTVTFSPASPVTFGTKVTFSATVAPGTTSGTPTGTVTFKDGAATLASGVTLNGSGVGTFSISSLGAGTQTITAVYSGDSNFQTSTSSNTVVVVSQAGTGTTVTPASPSLVSGQAISFTATITNTSGTGVQPTGTVEFFIAGNATPFSTKPVTPGAGASSATATSGATSFTAASGSHSITAIYLNSDGNFQSLTQGSTNQFTASRASTKTVITASDNTPTVGETVTYTARVTVKPPGFGTPTNGTVSFSVDGGAAVSENIGAGGIATDVVTWSTLLGAHTVDATYNGDSTPSNFAGSTATTDHVTRDIPTTKVSYTGTLTVAAPGFQPFATSIPVQPLFGDIAAGTTITWGSGAGAAAFRTTKAASEGATSISVTALTGGGESAGAVSNPLSFSGGSSQYGQANVLITATVSSGANHPTAGGVLWSDVLDTNIGSVTMSVTASARSTLLHVAALPGELQVGQQLQFIATATTSAAAAQGATFISVNALPQALLVGTELSFNSVTATVNAPTPQGATTIPVNALSGPIASGVTANTSVNTVTINGDTVTVTQVVLKAQASATATSLSVKPLAYALAAGTQLNFNGTVVTVAAGGAAANASTIPLASATGAVIANGSTNQIPKNATSLTVNALSEALSGGEHLVFGLQTLIVAAPGAFVGATRVPVSAIGAAIVGGTVSEPVDVALTTASASASATALSVRAINRPYAVTTITGHTTGTAGTIVQGTTLSFGTTNVVLEDISDNDTATVPTGATMLHVTSPEGIKNFAGGGIGQALPAGAQLKFGNVVVTLAAAASAGTSTISVQPTTGAITPGAGNSANPGDTTLYVEPISAAIASGTTSAAANAGATSFIVNDIGNLGIGVGAVASVDNHGNPLFMLGAKTTISPIGFTEVNGSGVTVLNESLLGSPALVLPGVVTSYNNNGQVASAPLASNIEAQYVDGARGGPSDPNYTAGPTSALSREFIAADPTTTTIAVSPAPGQFGVTETITATVKTPAADLLGPVGTVTFLDSYTIGGITTNTTLGTLTLPSLAAGVTQASVNFETASLAQTAHTLTAIYNGDNTAPFPLPTSFPFRDQWLGSQATGTLNVGQDGTTGTLSANPANSAAFGSSVTFLDTLTSGNGTTPHGGIVIFTDGTTRLGTTSVNIRGTAALVVNSRTVAGSPHQVQAFFQGNGNFTPSASNILSYTITPGASTTTITGPNSASSTVTLTVTNLSYVSGTGVVTATVSGGTLTSNVITIAGVTTPATGFNGVFDVNITGAHTFTYTVAMGLAAPSTTGITATEFIATPITVGHAFNLTASVVGQPGFTPTGTVVFVAESNNRDAVAATGPFFTPFTIGTATLANGIAVLAVPATGAGSMGSLASVAHDGDGADVFELDAFYRGDASYTHGNSTAITPHGGPVAAGDGELAVRDTAVGFYNAFGVVFSPIVSTDGAHGGVTVIGRIRDGAENGLGPPTGTNFTNTPQTGGVGGHFKIFLDGKQFTTSKGAPSTPQIASESGAFDVAKSGIVTPGQHVIVMEYMGDGTDGYLPPGATTVTFTEASIGASIGGANNSLASTKGSVVFSTAPKSSTNSMASSSTTSSQAKPSNTNGLSALGVDQLFSSTSGTTQSTPRTLAGALSHMNSGDDWLTGPF